MSKLDQSSVAIVPFHGAFTMSTGKRSNLALNTCSPGPAAYNLDSVNKKPKGINMNSKDKRNTEIEKKVPPVGSYDFKSYIGAGSKWTIQKRREENIQKGSNIGPGISFQFGHSRRVQQIESKSSLYPGPGSYQYDRFNNNSSHNFKFSKDLRFKNGEQKDEDVPGPGTFDILNTQNNQKSFSFGSKYSSSDNKLLVPGPGTYNIGDSHQNKINSIKFGSSKRLQMQDLNNFPGPGTYNVINDISIIMETNDGLENENKDNSQRTNLANMQKIPGPGTYNIPSQVGVGPKWIMKNKVTQSKWSDKKVLPGPGNYDISYEYDIKKSQAPKFGVQKKFLDDKRNLPGPTSYDTIQYKIKESPKFTFAQTKRNKDSFQELFEPSPNSYDIRSTIAGLPNYLKNDSSLNNSSIRK